MTPWTKRLGFIAASLAVATVLLARSGLSGEGKWARIARRDLVLSAEVEGVLEAVDTVGVSPPVVPGMWNFKISMLVPEGTHVEAGQPVASFDATGMQQTMRIKVGERDVAAGELEKRTNVLEIERQDLELSLAEAEAKIRRHQLELQVPESLVARREIELARIERDLAKFELDNLKRRLGLLARQTTAELSDLRRKRDRAAQRVDQLQQHLASLQVAAPRAGTVIYDKSRGEKPQVGDSVWQGQPILQIPNLEHLRATGEVDEAEIGRLAVGQPVELSLDAHPGHIFRGTIGAIRGAVRRHSASDPTKFVDVEIILETDPERMRPGMRFRGKIEVERVVDVLCLPLAAPDPQPEGPVVTVARGLFTEVVTVDLGRRDRECIEVLAGLVEGDRVQLHEGSGG